MRAKWRKVIWAILAVQLFLLHLLFMEYFLRNTYQLDSFIRRGVNHFGLPYVLYGRWKQFVVLAWLASAVFVMLINYINYVRFRRSCIGQIYMIADESVKQSLKDAVTETGLYDKEKEDAGRYFLYGSRMVREPFVIGFRDPILILPEREYSAQVLHFIFLHECYHIRHKDTLYKLFMLLMHSLLWFQPLIYLLISVSYRDVEVACDEAVVEGKDIAARKEYGYALLECLKMEREQGAAYSTYFYHGKRMMKARITAIMKEEKRPDSLAYAAIVILLTDVVFSFYCIGDNLYDSYRAKLVQLQAENFSQVAVDDMIKLTPVSEESSLPAGVSEIAYQVDTSGDVLKVSGADGEWMEVPITLEELYRRGDEMDGKLTSLQKGSYQVDENKIVFAYGGDNAVPFSVVYYEEESQSFKKSVVTYEFFGGRKIYVAFPENGQEGFLIFTGERVVWQESTILFHTMDGGKSWQLVGNAGPDVTVESHSLTTGAVFINNMVGFVTIRDSEIPNIWRTEDGGVTWEKQMLPEVPEYYSMAYAPEVNGDILCLYVGMEEYSEYGGSKAKYESADKGRTWEYKGLVTRK